MKKIMSMAIVLIALVTLSVSAFAADNGKQISESTFQENVVVKVSNAGKFMKEEEEFEILTPEEISSMETDLSAMQAQEDINNAGRE